MHIRKRRWCQPSYSLTKFLHNYIKEFIGTQIARKGKENIYTKKYVKLFTQNFPHHLAFFIFCFFKLCQIHSKQYILYIFHWKLYHAFLSNRVNYLSNIISLRQIVFKLLRQPKQTDRLTELKNFNFRNLHSLKHKILKKSRRVIFSRLQYFPYVSKGSKNNAVIT